MEFKKYIPNFITLLNLLSGCIAIVFIFDSNLAMASYLIFVAAIFDFFDGFAARALHVKSDIGKELDSLADIISFGLVPGFIMMKLLQSSLGVTVVDTRFTSVIPYIALLIPVFSALRLAKFNTDSRQTDRFIGLPTPANAMLIASFPLILEQNSTVTGIDTGIFQTLFSNFWFINILTLLLSYLLVAEIPLLSLKFKKGDKLTNQPKYFFIGLTLILIIVFNFVAIPFAFLLYFLISVFLKSKI
jgi:CDP-diacylglycerol---serine O-phosphatidyltransferase